MAADVVTSPPIGEYNIHYCVFYIHPIIDRLTCMLDWFMRRVSCEKCIVFTFVPFILVVYIVKLKYMVY